MNLSKKKLKYAIRYLKFKRKFLNFHKKKLELGKIVFFMEEVKVFNMTIGYQFNPVMVNQIREIKETKKS